MKAKRLLVVLAVAVCVAALAASAQQVATVATRVRVGGDVQQAKLIAQVQPEYPALARRAKITGTVRLEVSVSPTGTVEGVTVISGHPILVQPALDAVRQWKYAPTLLNGQPVGVVTTVDVFFKYEGDSPPSEENVPIPPAMETNIRRLLDLTGVTKSASESVSRMAEAVKRGLLSELPAGAPAKQIADRLDEKLDALTESNDYLKPFINFYGERFSPEEILDLIRFFETPAGQHYVKEVSLLNPQIVAMSQASIRENLGRITREMREEFPDLRRP